MSTIRISQLQDLAYTLGRDLDICEIGHLDQRLADLAKPRALVGGYDATEAQLTEALALEHAATVERLLPWTPAPRP